MPWHPVPSRAASAVLAGRCFDLQSAYWCCNLRLAYQTALGLYPLLFYKETAFCLYRLYCFSQCGIPHRTCRFYCCLAAHQRTRKKDSAEPSFPILWTPPHPPGGIRCGGAYLLPRVWDNLGIRYPVLSLLASSEYGLVALCSGWYRSRFSRVVGLVSHVFHYWGEGLFVPAATVGFAMVFRRICADRDWIDSLGG